MKAEPSGLEDINGNRRIFGACWLVYGIFRIIIGICLVLFTGTATVMFGALLGRVPNPYALMADFHLIYGGLVILSFLCGLVGVLAGLALLANQPSARTLALVASLLSVSEIPFGTTLGIYTLIAFIRTRDKNL
ncbi:MAG: hypothetical protein WAK20_12330 [Candidatus Acidiferrum sp.]